MVDRQANEEEGLTIRNYMARCAELAGGDLDKAELSRKLADLEGDFNYVVALNTDIAERYDYVFNLFPTVREIDLLIVNLRELLIIDGIDERVADKRVQKLKMFRSVLEAKERNDTAMKPKRFIPKVEDITRE